MPHTYNITDAPGVNIYRLRTEAQLSQRALADRCIPALDHTTIRRLERNLGYTQDTLERVAKVLRVSVSDLFLPPELADWAKLAPPARARIAETIRDAALAGRYRKASND